MRSLPALVAVCLLAGCQGQSRIVENPVVGPPPPRIPGASSVASNIDREVRDDLEEVVQVEARSDTDGQFFVEDPAPAPAPGPMGPAGQVAARVNGTPLFTAEILEPYAGQLAEVHAQVPPEQFEQLRQELLQRDLPQYIDQLLLYDRVMGQLDAEQRGQLNSQLASFFQMHIQDLMAAQNVRTLAELDQIMRASGSSLESARRAFERQEIAMQYLRESVNGSPSVSRTELLDEYHAQHDELTEPARIRWSQIRVSNNRPGSQGSAQSTVQTVLDELASGKSFDEVARAHSDGPLASNGGEWDWTQLESISNAALRSALGDLSVGEVSQPIEQGQGYLIVKLTGNRPVETTPFEDVQDEMRASISDRKRNEAIEAVVKELKSNAVITTMFDNDTSES